MRAICFDLFNTLVSVGQVPEDVGMFTADVLGVNRDIWNEACFGPQHDICNATNHQDVIRHLAHSIDPDIPEIRIQQATRDRQQRFDYALLHAHDSVLAALQQLRQAGYMLALISNASTGEVSVWQDSMLAVQFDHAIFSCHCGMQKPDLSIYQYALSLLDVEPEKCIYVGDGGSREFHGACDTGMHTVLTNQFHSPERRESVLRDQREKIRGEIMHIEELQEYIAVSCKQGGI